MTSLGQWEGIFSHTETQPGLWLIKEDYYVSGNRANIWLIKPREGGVSVLVDAGLGVHNVRQYMVHVGLVQEEEEVLVLLTHQHFDHSGGLQYFQSVCAHRSEVQGLESGDQRAAVSWLSDQEVALRPHTDWQSGQYRVRPVRVTRQLEDGDTVEGLEVIHLPGHSPGSLAFLDRERSWLFTGDTLYGGGGLIDWLPSSAPSQYLVSMDRLVKLLQEIPSLTVFPGHGPELSSGGAMAVAMEYCASAGPCHTLRVTALSWLVNIALHARHR